MPTQCYLAESVLTWLCLSASCRSGVDVPVASTATATVLFNCHGHISIARALCCQLIVHLLDMAGCPSFRCVVRSLCCDPLPVAPLRFDVLRPCLTTLVAAAVSRSAVRRTEPNFGRLWQRPERRCGTNLRSSAASAAAAAASQMSTLELPDRLSTEAELAALWRLSRRQRQGSGDLRGQRS